MKLGMWMGLSLLSAAFVLSGLQANEAPPPGIGAPKVAPQPAPPQPREVKLIVQVDEKARVPKLKVPVGLLLNPFIENAPVPPRGADGRRSALPTVVAGVALTLAFVSAGLWLARRRHGRTLALMGVLSLFAAGTAAVWADLGPRPLGPRREPIPQPPALPTLKLPANVTLSDKLYLELTSEGDHVTLILPKNEAPDKAKEAPTSAERRSR